MKLTHSCALKSLSFILFWLFTNSTLAHNKVVVVPLAGDDISAELSNVVTVAKSGGDFNNPIAALASITNASANNPYLLIIAPGVYTLSEQLVLKEYVTVTGSGMNATILRGTLGDTSTTSNAAMVLGANYTEISDLTIENKGSTESNSIGIYLDGVAMSIYRSRISVSDANGSYGVFSENSSDTRIVNSKVSVSDGNFQIGIISRNSSISRIQNSEVSMFGASSAQIGIVAALSASSQISDTVIKVDDGSSLQVGVISDPLGHSILNHVRIEVSDGPGPDYGIFTDSDEAYSRIANSHIEGPTSSVAASGSDGAFETYITDTILDGGAVTGDPKCNFVFTAAGDTLDGACVAPASP